MYTSCRMMHPTSTHFRLHVWYRLEFSVLVWVISHVVRLLIRPNVSLRREKVDSSPESHPNVPFDILRTFESIPQPLAQASTRDFQTRWWRAWGKRPHVLVFCKLDLEPSVGGLHTKVAKPTLKTWRIPQRSTSLLGSGRRF